MQDRENFNRLNFPRGMGDLGGFYFPLCRDVGILQVNKQMRREVLPVAFRHTTFRLDDMDDAIRLLIAVGRTGRDNIEMLELPWDSETDGECRWERISDPERHLRTLPTLHVSRCVQLLTLCRRLKSLRLFLQKDTISSMPVSAFMANPGISALCSVRDIEEVSVWSLGFESLEDSCHAKMLKESMERPISEAYLR